VAVAAGAVVAEAVVDAAVALAAPGAQLAVRPLATAVSAEAQRPPIARRRQGFIGRARSSTRPILVFVRLGGSPAANNFRANQKMPVERI